MPTEQQTEHKSVQGQMRQQYDRRYGAHPLHLKNGYTVLVLNYGRSGKPNWFEVKIIDVDQGLQQKSPCHRNVATIPVPTLPIQPTPRPQRQRRPPIRYSP
ncbi:hypothetical protein niasHS_017304 [Heterodera schachtii]|uniref:Uncharacterized protein n=1 Tax=Heterodera schachtii TaxID=97005 RepID=A0ABD2HRH6_HETSC